jgi:hypothetical protein
MRPQEFYERRLASAGGKGLISRSAGLVSRPRR